MTDLPLTYELGLEETEAGTGYFKATPQHAIDPPEMIDYLIRHPNDGFMRHHLIDLIGKKDKSVLGAFRGRQNHTTVAALFREAAILQLELNSAASDADLPAASASASPFIYLKSERREDRSLQREWIDLFRNNMEAHAALPHPADCAPPWPVSETAAADAARVSVPLAELHRRYADTEPLPRMPAIETAVLALERLADTGSIADEEQRHEASLSPIALLRKWHLNRTVRNGTLHYRLKGIQTSYGKGLDLDVARAAYTMEMVERISSFASIAPDGVIGYRHLHRLYHGSYNDLTHGPIPPLDPNSLHLEVPYEKNDQLYWIEGHRRTINGEMPALVPAQSVFLFCNLDEIKLFSGLGSTGLASGNTMAEAKVAAILEVIERDSEAVTPFDPAGCFTVETADERLNHLLQSYADQGIFLQFQDLTQPMGVPCCKCHVIHPSGNIIKGTGAHLDARRALISALTETPYPFPNGSASLMPMHSGIRVPLENLPDYSTGNAETDLDLLETLLLENGFSPIYVDLTREDLGLPVVRVIIPGMDILGDFGPFSRIHPRLFANYLKMFHDQRPSASGSSKRHSRTD